MKRNFFNLFDLNVLNNDNLYNNLPDCLSDLPYDIASYSQNNVNKNNIKYFKIDCIDTDIIFKNEQTLYLFVKKRIAYKNERYIFTIKKLKYKISIIMQTIDDIIQCIMKHYIIYI